MIESRIPRLVVLYGESETDTRGYYSSYEDGENFLLGLLEDEGGYYVDVWPVRDIGTDADLFSGRTRSWEKVKGEPLSWEQAKVEWVEATGIELEEIETPPDEIS